MLRTMLLSVAALAPHADPPGTPGQGGAPGPHDGASGVVAIMGDRTVSWDRVRPVLSEMSGGAALREVMLDDLVERRAKERGLVADDAALALEERTLLEYLDRDPARAERLLSELRARQGLGPVRWKALLRRNALLRALVSPDVEVQDAQVRAAHDAAHGPKRGARVIAVPDLRAAQSVSDRLARGDRFEDVAAEVSTDPSASRGGLVNPMSRLDPSVPAGVREALWAIPEVGGTSPPVLVTTGYLVIRRGADEAGDGVSLESVRAEAERAVRLAQERARMDALAQDMLRGAAPDVLDESVARSWRELTTASTRPAPPPPG